MNDDRTILNQITHDLTSVAETTQVRGQGSGAFVFAESGARVVEVSWSTEGWWVEFWKGDDAIQERTYSSQEEAILEARRWLMRKS